MNWIFDRPLPKDRAGNYFVWLSKPVHGSGSYIATANVLRCSNGFLTVIGDHFANDVLDKENFIVAWCEQPKKLSGS